LMVILKDSKYERNREELIKDYVKVNFRIFESLAGKLEIQKHVKTKKYTMFLSKPECMKILWRYCVGLDLGVKDQMVLVDNFNAEEIKSIRRIYHNLKAEQSGKDPIVDNKFLRFIGLRSWIRAMKEIDNPVKLETDDLKQFAMSFNNKNGKTYNVLDIKGVVQDLRDIFDIEMIIQGNKRSYLVGDEWSIENVRGIDMSDDCIDS